MSTYNFNYEYNNNNQDGFQTTNDNSSSTGRKNLTNQNLRPVTIKQIYSASQLVPEGPFSLNGKDLDHISLIGKIQNIQFMSTKTNYKIEDGTGSIDVIEWINTNDDDSEAQKRSQWSKEGHYIKVIGSLRTSQQDNKGVLAFNIRSIENFNEITSHFLEIIKINLEEKKNNNSYGNQEKILPSFNNSDYAPQNYNDNIPAMGTGDYTQSQQAIINLIKSQKLGEEGMHVETICKMLNGKFNEEDIRRSIEWLVNECHLYYTTIDESHVNFVQF
ncbi:replication protein A, subunit RPA32 [Neocallimastix lanati (nom. inval.)]|jgi:replication factor A2|uniref:Replication protein A, subunit RPA32 n=1 Tax=Neocallimastix californiae TaxID=1754190 RepID=A0A1Y2EQD0_9FUNG|nr:replication protein A, subunit RPA32 [Neocallimastix sp. JGI-2020a]ORY73803.1 replication protein A, subunit RPA32 [Neocallimastix californiae]|eukprot:ORY73803.1 replication protein A, subunit RPA32 [Neocallimastix californiae]